jgi:hypothetical protein
MKIKVEFKGDSGNALIATFDRDAGTVSANDGRSGTYTRPEGSKTLEIKESSGQALTLTFAEDVKFEPGFSTRYSGPQGDGVATILAIE